MVQESGGRQCEAVGPGDEEVSGVPTEHGTDSERRQVCQQI